MAHAHRALLERALEIHIGDLIAQIRRLVDQRDQPVFHRQRHLGARLDVFAEDSRRGDVQGAAAVKRGKKKRGLVMGGTGGDGVWELGIGD